MRDGRVDCVANLRAFLHHQGWRGNGIGSGDGLRNRKAVGRLHLRGDRARKGNEVSHPVSHCSGRGFGAAETGRARDQGFGSETILLVEDENSVLDLAQHILQKRGYKVLPARNGGDALRIASMPNQQIDLVVTDVVMPGMNGREFVEALNGCPSDSCGVHVRIYGRRYHQARPHRLERYVPSEAFHGKESGPTRSRRPRRDLKLLAASQATCPERVGRLDLGAFRNTFTRLWRNAAYRACQNEKNCLPE